MSIIVRAQNVVEAIDGSNSYATIPGTAIAGELILIATNYYNTPPSIPAGYTQAGTTASAYTSPSTLYEYHAVFYKVAVGGETGNVVIAGGFGTYGSNRTLLLSGVNTTSIVALNTTVSGYQASSVEFGPSNVFTYGAGGGRRFYLGSTMDEVQTPTTISFPNTPPLTILTTHSNAQAYTASLGGYSASETGTVSYGGSTYAIQASKSGAMILRMIAINAAVNMLPTAPTAVSVNNSPVTVNIQPNVIWTHNDSDGHPQSKYQLRWRMID